MAKKSNHKERITKSCFGRGSSDRDEIIRQARWLCGAVTIQKDGLHALGKCPECREQTLLFGLDEDEATFGMFSCVNDGCKRMLGQFFAEPPEAR